MRILKLAAVASVLFAASSTYAIDINQGQTVSGITVLGATSVYGVFGHPGNPGGDTGVAEPAVLFQFESSASNIFSFSTSGAISGCPTCTVTLPPDGAEFIQYIGNINILAANGLSGISGTSYQPFTGVFTSEVDPFNGTAPSSLIFDAANPSGITPEINQVFYIGDGHSGYNTLLGDSLFFKAPNNATRLYLGIIDASGNYGFPGAYGDNTGQFIVDVSLSVAPIPEPETYALMLAGLAMVGAAARRSKNSGANA